jgi:hypothetical protein
MPRPVVPILAAALFAVGLARHVQRRVEWQDQRAGLADAQARAHLNAGLLQPFDFLEQLGCRQHHTVADVALDARAHDAAGDQVQRGLDAVDDQRVAGVVAALEAHHALGAFGQPVDQLALAFVAPLGADDDDVATLGCFISGFAFSNGFHDPLPRNLPARGHTGTHRLRFRGPAARTPRFRPRAQRGNGRAQVLPRSRARGWPHAAAAAAHAHQRLDIQAEPHGRAVAAEDRADLVIAPAAHQRIAGPPA